MLAGQGVHMAIEVDPSQRVQQDTLRYDFIADQFEQLYQRSLFNPLEDETASERLVAVRAGWENSPVTTVLTSGVYDLLHLDHTGYLLHTKAVGAPVHYERFYRNGDVAWEELSAQDQEAFISMFLRMQELRLIVSVDGDMSVRVRKGFKPEKGGGDRPVFSWQTRARMVAGLTFPSVTGNHVTHQSIADAVTVHGPDDFPEGHPHHDLLALATVLQPDAWAIYGESEDLLTAAPVHEHLGGVALRCIMDGPENHYFSDELIGGKFSTTKIVNRIAGNK
jgi:hypothetical protein